ncbi:MAG: type IV pilus modification PilV family protein [Opitutaceae bacterium]
MFGETRTRVRCRQAFTLVEVLIALVIFAIVIASGFACIKMGLQQVDNARHHTRSAQIMQSEVENIRSLPWAKLIALQTAETTIPIASQFGDSTYSSYTMKRSIAGNGNVRKITFVVTWKDISGKSHSKTYVTQYTKGGLYDYIQ